MNATFTAPNGADPIAQIHLVVEAARPTRADLLDGGNLLIADIRDRTFGGVDVDGNPFVPYSPAYAKKKSGALGHGRVDLFGADHHTHMLNALQVLVDSDNSFGVGIYSNDELEMRARVHNEGLTVRTRLGQGRFDPETFRYKSKGVLSGKASFDMPQRRWLDANPTDVQTVNDAIGERIDERLKRLI